MRVLSGSATKDCGLSSRPIMADLHLCRPCRDEIIERSSNLAIQNAPKHLAIQAQRL